MKAPNINAVSMVAESVGGWWCGGYEILKKIPILELSKIRNLILELRNFRTVSLFKWCIEQFNKSLGLGAAQPLTLDNVRLLGARQGAQGAKLGHQRRRIRRVDATRGAKDFCNAIRLVRFWP